MSLLRRHTPIDDFLTIKEQLGTATAASTIVVGTQKIAYGDSNVTITITLGSLANGSSRESDYVDNSTNLWLDCLVSGVIKTGASPTNTGKINVYAYGTVDGGTTYTGGCTGSDAAYTFELTLKLLDIISNSSTGATEYEFGPISLSNAFGGWVTERWGIVVKNNSGDALASSGSSLWYQGVYQTIT